MTRMRARFLRNKGAVVGSVVLIAVVALAVTADWVAPRDPIDTDFGARLQPPSREHLMGTDQLGRDIFSRVAVGSRVSLAVGGLSLCIGAVIGTLTGLVAAYEGGWVESVIMRFYDAMLAFPGILLALALIAALGPNIRNAAIAIGIATVPQFARLVRGNVLQVKEEIYVMAARAIGCGGSRIVMRHVLPNVIAPVIVLSTLQFGAAILSVAGLSFLGLGAQRPSPEWGLMVSVGRDFIGTAWWMSTFPGLAITLVVVSLNLAGDGLRESLDPTVRRV